MVHGRFETIRLIGEDGALAAHPDYPLELGDDELRELYRQLVAVRRVDATGATLQRQGELGSWTPCFGQEAAQVGSAWALEPGDFVFPSYREHGIAMVRGLDPAALFVRPRGVALSGWEPHGRRFAPYTIPIGTQTLHATGYAIGAKWDGDSTVVLCCFGDGATSSGDVSEALNFAAVNAAPIVFLCQNNQYAISVPVAKQAAAPLAARGDAFGMPGVRVDGNDVLAVHAVTRRAVELARSGAGPTLIEAVTYRLGPHTTADDPSRYRTEDELRAWRALDPIDRYRAFLRHKGLDSGDLELDAEARAERLAEEVLRAVKAMAAPPLAQLTGHVYAVPPATFTRQQERLAAFERSFDDPGAPA